MFGLFKSNKTTDVAHDLYSAIVTQARQVVFYTDYGVPDTVDGRFDLIVLHAHILFDRLKDGTADEEILSQAIFDLMFADMDQNLREMGVGDIGVAKRVKAMVEAFFGRATAYADALKQPDDHDLSSALKRNLFRKTEPSDNQIHAATTYFRSQVRHLGTQDLAGFHRGSVDFLTPELPATLL